MASILKSLSDDDLEAIRHMIRRDAHTDLEIAEEAEKRLAANPSTKKLRAGIGATPKARQCVIERERKSAEFKRWRDRWENQDVDLKRDIALQKQAFEYLTNLVSKPGVDAMQVASQKLLADFLVVAAKMSPEERLQAMGAGGWLKNVITAVQTNSEAERTAQGEKAAEIVGDTSFSKAEQQKRIREIFQ